jgi:hypothetical protein
MLKRGMFNRCVECDEVITNPICSECLAEKMRLVIRKFDSELAEQIVGSEISGDTQCIFCKKEMGLCAHCFSRDIYELLMIKNKRAANQFLLHFNFEIRDPGMII